MSLFKIEVCEQSHATVRTNAGLGAAMIQHTLGTDVLEHNTQFIGARILKRGASIVNAATDLTGKELAKHVRSRLKSWHKSIMVTGFEELGIDTDTLPFPDDGQQKGTFYSLCKRYKGKDGIESVRPGTSFNARVQEICKVAEVLGAEAVSACDNMGELAKAAKTARETGGSDEAKAASAVREVFSAMLEACNTTEDYIALKEQLVAAAEAQVVTKVEKAA